MKKICLIGLILFLAALPLSGCGGGGGEADTNAPATVDVIPSKTMALADGSDAVTLLAEVNKADGAPVADGTTVTFAVPDNSGSLSAATATTANGIASVSLTRAPLTGANNQKVTVTCSAGGISGATDVKFINQPASVDVFIAFDQAVTNLAALDFKLNNTAGTTFDNLAQRIAAVNPAAGSLVVGNFDDAANSTMIGLVNGGVSGFNTGTGPIIKVTFAVAADAGLPSFSIDQTPASLTATDPNGVAVTPAVTAANLVVTATFDTEL